MFGNVWRNDFFYIYVPLSLYLIWHHIRANLVHGISCGSHNTIHPLLPLLSLLSSLLFILFHYLLLLFIKKKKQKNKKTVRMRRVHVYYIINQIYFVWFISSLLIDKESWQGIFSRKILLIKIYILKKQFHTKQVILGRNLNATLQLKCSWAGVGKLFW